MQELKRAPPVLGKINIKMLGFLFLLLSQNLFKLIRTGNTPQSLRNLLGRELGHGVGIEFFAHLGAHGVNKHLEKLVHVLGYSLAELVVVDLNLHNLCRGKGQLIR